MELPDCDQVSEIDHQVFGCPETPGEDGFTIYGPRQRVIFTRCVFDFTNCDDSTLDEILDGVKGARVTLRGCILLGGIKAILAGNGDFPDEDKRARWELDGCFIWGAGRRCPEAQDGAKVTMYRCWVADWGKHFNVRSFGAWAHNGGFIEARECLFTQSRGLSSLGLKNTIVDLANHVGQACNDDGLKALFKRRTYLPGVARGLTGNVVCFDCYRNRPWIRLDNCHGEINASKASDIVDYIEMLSGYTIPQDKKLNFER